MMLSSNCVGLCVCVRVRIRSSFLFSCAKDRNPAAWFADNSERLGTYRGHNDVVW